MSSLVLSLVILALIGVGAILLYNLWLGGLLRRRPARRDPGEAEAPVRQEPRFGAVAAPLAEAPAGADEHDPDSMPTPDDEALVAHSQDTAAGPSAPAVGDRAAGPAGQREDAVLHAQDRMLEEQAARAGIAPVAGLDVRADCCVTIALERVLPGERLLTLTRSLRRAGSKPIVVEASTQALPARPGPAALAATGAAQAARDATSDGAASETATETGPDGGPEGGPETAANGTEAEPGATGTPPSAVPPLAAGAAHDASMQWEALAAGRQYRSLRIGVLMANRHGPINAMEFSEFNNDVQALAGKLGVRVEPPDMIEVLERARELDAFCARLDAQIGVNVEVGEALAPAVLAQIAETVGVVERANNRYARLGENGEPVFSLGLGASPDQLTLLLDVPRVAAAHEPLRAMVACAWQCAQALDGRMVDDSGRPLTEAVFTRIEAQLEERYRALEAAGIAAGSPIALRLFN